MTESRARGRLTGSLTIRERLLRGFLVVFILLMTSVVTNTWTLTRLESANRELDAGGERVASTLEVAEATANVLAVLGTPSSSQGENYVSAVIEPARDILLEAHASLVDSVQSLPLGDPLRVETMQLLRRTNRVDAFSDLIIPAIEAGNWENVARYQEQMHAEYLGTVVRSVDLAIELAEERQLAATVRFANAYRASVILRASLAGLALLAAGVTAVATIRSITGPAEQLVEAAVLLSTGSLDLRVPVERQDEFGQIGAAFNEMAERLEGLYIDMEQRVTERTRALQDANYALQRRAIQLEASAEVARSIASIFDLEQLLRQGVNLIRDQFGFYHSGIFLMDDSGEWAILREATGDAGAQMKAQGHRLRVAETSMVGWTALHRRPRITQQVGDDQVRYAHPLLPYTRSEMCLPLLFGGQLLGVLNVQSTEEEAFDDDDIRALQSMANQLAVAIQNARRLSQESSLLEATSPIYRVGRRLTSSTTVDEVADSIVESVADTGADGCVLVEFELAPDNIPMALMYLRVWRRDREPLFQPGMKLPISESPFPIEMISTMWEVSDIELDKSLPESAREVFRNTGARALVNIPLRSGAKIIGQVVVLRSTPGTFSESTMRFYETWSDQVAVALERARLLEKTQQRAEQERIIRDISDRLFQANDMESLMQIAVDQLRLELGGARGFVRLGAVTDDGDDGTGPERETANTIKGQMA